MLSKIHTHKQTIHMQSVNKGCISIPRFSQKSMPSSVRFLPRSSDNLTFPFIFSKDKCIIKRASEIIIKTITLLHKLNHSGFFGRFWFSLMFALKSSFLLHQVICIYKLHSERKNINKPWQKIYLASSYGSTGWGVFKEGIQN